MSARRWRCPNAEHPGVLAPERMRKDDVRRFCWPCSEALGRLVQRTHVAAERSRAAEAQARATAEAETERRRAERAASAEQRKVERAARRTARVQAERAQRDAAIERYARYCGPAVLAKRLGIKRTTAAKRLMKEQEGYSFNGHSTPTWALGRALRRAGQPTRYWRASGNQTLRQWRDTNPGATAIVQVTGHWVYLSSGRLIEHNGLKSSRAIVREVISFDPAPRPAEVVQHG